MMTFAGTHLKVAVKSIWSTRAVTMEKGEACPSSWEQPNTGCFFLVGPPLFPYQKVKLLLAPRAAAPFKKAFGWLQVVFPFGTENGEGRLKTHTVHTVKGSVKHFRGHKLLLVVGLRHV